MLTMNYIGGVNVLDRGDGPAQAILDKNARNRAQRVANETKEELGKVLNRVDNIYGNFEHSADSGSNLEYVNDIMELEDLIKDEIKKRKYQQQVTIFIVGFETVSGQRLRLLQQVNEFFTDNQNNFEDETEWRGTSPDIDLDEVSDKITESLETANSLTQRLAELNHEMIEYWQNYAMTKASNNPRAFILDQRGKKKLEKALSQAKDDIMALSEKLMAAQTDLEHKEEKMQLLYKQVEMKSMESQRYKTAAEIAKKNANEAEHIREELERKNSQLMELKKKVEELELDVAQKDYAREITRNKLKEANEQNAVIENKLDSKLVNSQMSDKEAREEITQYFEQQISDLVQGQRQELRQLRKEHDEEVKRYKEDIGNLNAEKQDSYVEEKSEISRISRQSSRQWSDAPSTPVRSARHLSREPSELSRTPTDISKVSLKDSKSPTRQITRKNSKIKIAGKQGKKEKSQDVDPSDEEVAEDNKAPSTRQSKRSKSTLEPVQEADLGNAYDIDDEAAWSAVPQQEMPGRFLQFRQLSRKKMQDLEEQLTSTTNRTSKKVNTLKAQFQEHKKVWEDQRYKLLEEIEKLEQMQKDTKQQADAALDQLEDFINEQEAFEDEEETRRSQTASALPVQSINKPSPATVPAQLVSSLDGATAAVTPSKVMTPPKVESKLPSSTENNNNETELSDLMQQTDDAKVQDMVSRSREKIPSDMSLQDQLDTRSSSQNTPSAASRVSIRSQYKAKLQERRTALEEKARTKSPTISLRSRNSISAMEIDEDGDIPFPDEYIDEHRKSLHDVGTSPLSFAGTTRSSLPSDTTEEDITNWKSMMMSEHPIVQEYMKTYDSVIKFKETISSMLQDKEMMSASVQLHDIQTPVFDDKDKVQPQIEIMTESSTSILHNAIDIFGNILVQNIQDREPAVSSLKLGVSREPTLTIMEEKSSESSHVQTRQSMHSVESKAATSRLDSMEAKPIQDLEEQHAKLTQLLEEQALKHQDEISRNQDMMMDMQDTIMELKKELAALGQTYRDTPFSTPAKQLEEVDSAVMFTRLDSDRNSKTMKRAVNDKKLSPELYQNAVRHMDEYVNIPAERLSHLVRKYVHHCNMKHIEDSVRRSKSLNDEVFHVLDRMESLQNSRARKWADHMDHLGEKRLELAGSLMEILESVEQESGIFLIKPMFSYRGRLPLQRYNGPLSKPFHAQRELSPLRDRHYVPAPTPASNHVRSATYRKTTVPQAKECLPTISDNRPIEDSNGISGLGVNWVGDVPLTMWSMNASQAKGTGSTLSDKFTLQNSLVNTPRMLELDVNRMMIGQNQVSGKVTGSLSNDRLTNAALTSTRNYVVVNRPSANPVQPPKKDRPRSHTGVSDSGAPPTTPMSMSSSAKAEKRIKMTEGGDIPSALPSTPPLPPITPRQGEGDELVDETIPTQSSSFRQSLTEGHDDPPPQHVTKIVTRTPSAHSNRSLDLNED